jgi:hypothetical protein
MANLAASQVWADPVVLGGPGTITSVQAQNPSGGPNEPMGRAAYLNIYDALDAASVRKAMQAGTATPRAQYVIPAGSIGPNVGEGTDGSIDETGLNIVCSLGVVVAVCAASIGNAAVLLPCAVQIQTA